MAGDCPRPDKVAHRSRGAGNSALLSLWLATAELDERLMLHVYKCQCGSFHVGHRPEWDKKDG